MKENKTRPKKGGKKRKEGRKRKNRKGKVAKINLTAFPSMESLHREAIFSVSLRRDHPSSGVSVCLDSTHGRVSMITKEHVSTGISKARDKQRK